MGGEPTFVSIDDPDGDEWNTTALGPTKRKYADTLLHRLAKRFAPGGLLHHGQGKWYPGEPLPRWAFSCYFRKDGEPIWNDQRLFADEATPRTHGAPEAKSFVDKLCARLGVEGRFALPGFEDVFYYLWRERRLPVNVDPFDSKLEDPQERARLRRTFEQGTARAAVGYALPLRPQWERDGLRWVSGPFFLRDERMYLIPGDSAMGYRLPLDSLPWMAPEDTQYHWPRDPFAPRAKLPSRKELSEPKPGPVGEGASKGKERAPAQPRAPGAQESASWADAHRAVRGAARRHLARLHAAALAARGVPRPDRGPRGHGRRAEAADPARGLPPAERPSPAAHPGHARSRRIDRGEHPPRELLARGRRDHQRRLRGGQGVAPDQRQVHDRRPPRGHRLAATTSRWAGPRPPTARSCAGPIYCAASPATGSITLPSPTCSPGCSWDPRARLRASTRRATTRCTSSTSPSARCRSATRPRRPGWSTACFATCWWTSLATRTAPSSASTSSTAPTAAPAARACSSCARSRCRPTRA